MWVFMMLRSYLPELVRSILVVRLECRFLDAEVDGWNPGISMLWRGMILAAHSLGDITWFKAVVSVCGGIMVSGQLH